MAVRGGSSRSSAVAMESGFMVAKLWEARSSWRTLFPKFHRLAWKLCGFNKKIAAESWPVPMCSGRIAHICEGLFVMAAKDRCNSPKSEERSALLYCLVRVESLPNNKKSAASQETLNKHGLSKHLNDNSSREKKEVSRWRVICKSY